MTIKTVLCIKQGLICRGEYIEFRYLRSFCSLSLFFSQFQRPLLQTNKNMTKKLGSSKAYFSVLLKGVLNSPFIFTNSPIFHRLPPNIFPICTIKILREGARAHVASLAPPLVLILKFVI